MISMVQRVDLKKEEIYSICSSEEEEVEEDKEGAGNKCLRLSQPRKLLTLLLKIFIMGKLSNCNTTEPDVVRNVMEREVRTYKNVKHAKEKVLQYKCIKWVQECINKFRNIVTNVVDRDKSYLKLANVRPVMGRKCIRRQKPSKSQSKRVHQTIIQSQCQVKVMKFLMLWREI